MFSIKVYQKNAYIENPHYYWLQLYLEKTKGFTNKGCDLTNKEYDFTNKGMISQINYRISQIL